MENLKDPEVEAWFKGQNDYARSRLAAIPGRSELLRRIHELMESVPSVDAYRLPGGVYLISKMLPSDDTAKMYVRRGLNAEDKLLLDPRKIVLAPANQAKGKNEILDISPSGDGKYVVFGITPGGSEENTELHVIDIATGRETDDVLSRGVGVEAWYPSWLPDNRSFVYGRLQDLPPGAPAAEVRQKFRSYLHVLGTPVSQDRPVFGNGVVPSIEVDPSLIASVVIRPGARYALGRLNGSVTRNSEYYIAPADSIGKPGTPWRKIADFNDGVTGAAVHGDELYLLTYKDAARFKVLRTDARKPDLASAEVVVPQGEPVIRGIGAAQDALYVRLLDGGPSRVLRVPYGPNPKAERLTLPFEGSVETDTDARLPGALLFVHAWTKSLRIHEYDPVSKRAADTRLQPLGRFDDPPGLVAEEVKARSYDGTMVPLSILRKKDLKLDGSNPTYLWGYGAYGTTQEPGFNRVLLAWLERGGVYSVCHVRGGGEYGEEWHLAGKGPTKPNTWKDFIACAEYLTGHGYTTPAHLAGEGASMGGVLIGRAITERPDLFGAAVISVGLADTLRAELTDNGHTNIPETGSTKTEAGFRALYEMSPYHHVKDGTSYPAVLVMTGINDPRVDPWHPGKLAARLQAASTSGKPVLLRVDYGGGHGSGGGKQDMLENVADRMSFLFWQLGASQFQPQR
jgi:prolyl oligopeptidase